jgi:hypothetical protein
MKNQYKIVKLDKRHKGYNLFSYYVDFFQPLDWKVNGIDKIDDFVERRIWFWENFGPANELDYSTYGTDTKWAWWRDAQHLNLYLNDEGMSAYLLHWS